MDHQVDAQRSLVGRAPPLNWEVALNEHGRWLRTVVAARLGEAQAVDEVMQEVALAAVRQAAPLADPSKVGPWLYRLAVRQALMYRRRRGRGRKLLRRYAQELPAGSEADSGDPLSWLVHDERVRLVRDAMEHLPRRESEILLLKYGEDWSYDQIGQHLGISRHAVESRLFRARQRLRGMLTSVEGENQREGLPI